MRKKTVELEEYLCIAYKDRTITNRLDAPTNNEYPDLAKDLRAHGLKVRITAETLYICEVPSTYAVVRIKGSLEDVDAGLDLLIKKLGDLPDAVQRTSLFGIPLKGSGSTKGAYAALKARCAAAGQKIHSMLTDPQYFHSID